MYGEFCIAMAFVNWRRRPGVKSVEFEKIELLIICMDKTTLGILVWLEDTPTS